MGTHRAQNVDLNENDDNLESKFQAFVLSNVTKVSKEWNEELSKKLTSQFESLKEIILGLRSDLVSKVNEASKSAAAAEATANANSIAISELKADMVMMKNEIKCLKSENYELKVQNNITESYTRRDNIVFNGITEPANETNEQCWNAARGFMETTLKISHEKAQSIRFVRCHRLQANGNGVRPIIVRFREWADRVFVWEHISKIPKDSKFYICEDYPMAVRSNRKKLMPIFHRARSTVGRNAVSLKSDVLTISGSKYTVRNINRLTGELNPRCFTRKTSYDTLIFGGSLSEYECLSNWGKFPVTHKGTTYPTLEHAFMHIKCITNGDMYAAEQVLESREPYKVKQIGDRITIDQNVWTAKKSEEIMTTLLNAKFTKGSDVATNLLQTGDKYLAESGKNKLYACGLPMTSKDVLNRTAHTGKNRLGQLLMKKRAELRKQK